MSGLDDVSLAARLAAGEERAFETLYDRYAARLYRAALRMLGRSEDAEDVVQEVFAGVVRSRARLTEVRNLSAYLFASLQRAAARAAAGRARRPSPADHSTLDAMGRVIDKRSPAEAARLERAVRMLPTEQREVLALKIDGQLTFVEIGELLRVSPNTAASRYRYALEKLRAALESPF